ncbi:MAG: hypothetical protein P4L33_00415 [Capsulimonadaceae bacterium]|nr:hypothetical protein [Capsulimonadaceae bacterium]
MTIRLCAALAALAFTPLCAYAQQAASAGSGVLLWSFESRDELSAIKATDGASASLVSEGVTQGKSALAARFEKGVWPTLKWSAPAGSPWDWSRHATLAFDVDNPSDASVTFDVRVDDGPVAWSPKMMHVHSGSASIPPHGAGTYFVDLAAADDPGERGMKCPPPSMPRPGMIEMVGSGLVDPSHIIAYSLFVERPLKPVTLIFDNIRLIPSVVVSGRNEKLVDRFGQFAKADWPGKVHDDADLAKAWVKERPSLFAVADRDEYGGWSSGPQLPATGTFTTVKRDGRWWFVDPSGHLFWAIGVNGPVINSATVVTGREAMFTWLPGADDPLAKHFAPLGHVFAGPVKSGQTYDFYSANLERKFGPGYLQSWRDETLARMKSWGMNSMSGWNLDLQAANAIPFIKNLGPANRHAKIPAGGWGPMDDPWDPQFAVDAEQRFRAEVAPLDKNPMCIGFLVGNEMSWGGGNPEAGPEAHYRLAFAALSLNGDSPAKRYFVETLRKKYGDISAFNQAWGISESDWDSVLATPLPKLPSLTESAQADASAFLAAHARQWFHVIHDQLKNAAPSKLFLGCRFADFTPEAVAAAGEYADAVSFNIYHTTALDSSRWGFLQAIGKPVIVTEWHFGAVDRGMFGGGLGLVRDQAGRAASYQAFAGNLLDNPVVIGEQWFQYNDQPLTGRSFDGENYNIGFVSVADQPYPELVAAARALNASAYARHAASK